jgi:chemotaxis protein CheD
MHRYPPNVTPLLKPGSAIDVFLQPGEWFVGGADFRVRTLLGSCVSITLWHPGRQVGAMSHFLLARRARASEQPDGRYGDDALDLMCAGLVAQGVDPRQCVAKLFGGADMFCSVPAARELRIGRNNGDAAREMLATRGIAVRAEHLFGAGHRQVLFDIKDGDVWVRQVAPTGDAAPLAKVRR